MPLKCRQIYHAVWHHCPKLDFEHVSPDLDSEYRITREKCGTVQIKTKIYKYIGICRDFCYYWKWCGGGRLVTIQSFSVIIAKSADVNDEKTGGGLNW